MGNAVRKHHRHSAAGGFTLLELVIASLILGILAVGSLGYQYHATRSARNSEVQANASRLAKVCLDHWKGMGGKDDYDPAASLGPSLTVDASAVGPEAAVDDDTSFTVLGHYRIRINNDHYFLTCSRLEASASKPRLLNVAVAWRPDYADGVLNSDAREVRYSVFCGQ
jgi:prepilin-type N-terminal cleavage/methylation domain-containing protein